MITNGTNASNNNDQLSFAISSSFMTTNVAFDVSSDVVDSLRKRWMTVVSPLLRDDASIRCWWWWDRIVSLHSAPDRRYHTLMHLHEMMGFLDIMKQSRNPIMILAVFFHDAIYDAKSSTNEEESAKLFQEFCADVHASNSDIEASVVQYILLTKSHIVPQDSDDFTLALFLDIDMAVLGKEESAYLHYAGLIRHEYHFVERSVYCEKRAEVLTSFLRESQIFASAPMREALEEQARRNLLKEIELLKSGIIPGEADS
jgi:predicted metal-dependent HD superfamily phosphohydrolase